MRLQAWQVVQCACTCAAECAAFSDTHTHTHTPPHRRFGQVYHDDYVRLRRKPDGSVDYREGALLAGEGGGFDDDDDEDEEEDDEVLIW